MRSAKRCAAEPGLATLEWVPALRMRGTACRARVRDTRSYSSFPIATAVSRHAVGETPFIVVPGHHPHQRAVLHLGLVHVEGGRVRIVVEVDRDVGRGGVAEDALELLLGGALHRLVDFLHVGLALGDDLEIDHRDVRGRHADRDAVELALQLRQHQADRLGRTGRGRDHRHRRRAAAIEVACAGCRASAGRRYRRGSWS